MYVYAVIEPGAVLAPARGLAGEPLQAVACAGVVVVAGTLDQAPALDAAGLRGHDAAVRRIQSAVPALLPARFGTVVAGLAELQAALGSRGDALRAALLGVREREQMTLRVAAAGGLAAEDEPPVPEGPGTRYLAARSGAALRRRPEVGGVLDGLQDLVRAERIERVDRPPLLATVYHLVDRGGAGAYMARLDALRPAAPGLRLTASGPWPPYAFAEAADW
jgi:hypothetical protein